MLLNTFEIYFIDFKERDFKGNTSYILSSKKRLGQNFTYTNQKKEKVSWPIAIVETYYIYLKNSKRKGENYGFDWLGFVKIIFNFLLKKFSLFRMRVLGIFKFLNLLKNSERCGRQIQIVGVNWEGYLLYVGQDKWFFVVDKFNNYNSEMRFKH